MTETETTGTAGRIGLVSAERARRSQTVGKLVEAMAKAQGEIVPPAKNKTAKIPTKQGSADYSYSYVDLAEIMTAVRPVLSKLGILLTQDSTTTRETVSVTTTLRLAEEWIEFGPFVLPVANQTAQGFGSALTYARRYALTAALGIASEADDDGALASRAGSTADRSKKASEAQMKRLHALGSEKGVTHEGLRDWAGRNLGIESLAELTTAGAKQMMDELEKLPDAEAGGAAQSAPEGDQGDAPAAPKDASGAPASAPADDLAVLWAEAIEVMGSRKAVIDWYRDEYKATGTVSTKRMTAEELRHLIEIARASSAAAEPPAEESGA